MMQTVVLIGHGSNSPDANAALATLGAELGASLGARVEVGYLEFAEPTVATALSNAAAAGATRIVLLPFFLSPGMHVRRDLERIVEDVRRDRGVEIEITPYLGSHPEIPRLLADTARKALG